jgi:hypothetical protein
MEICIGRAHLRGPDVDTEEAGWMSADREIIALLHSQLHTSEYTSLCLHHDSTMEGLSVAQKSLVAKLVHDKPIYCKSVRFTWSPPCAMEAMPVRVRSLSADELRFY